MAFSLDRLLGRLLENFTADRDLHIANLRELRRFLELPYDILPMIQKDTLPTASDWPIGTLVVKTDAGEPHLYINKTTGWFKVRDMQNTP